MTSLILSSSSSSSFHKRILILGFFFRHNLGDDTYVHVFSELLGSHALVTFVSMDDLTESHVKDADVIVCGGGDIINDYFIRKLMRFSSLLTLKPCYAISVGIAYKDDAPLARIFDHLFVRSSTCKDVIVGSTSSSRVTVMPDLAFALSLSAAPALPLTKNDDTCYNLAVCLAQPVFNSRSDLVKGIARAIRSTVVSLTTTLNKRVVIHLVPFNTHLHNHKESDLVLNAMLLEHIALENVVLVDANACNTVELMQSLMSSMDGAICMRYHSAVYAILAQIPFYCVYTTQKMQRLLADLSTEKDDISSFSSRLPTDDYGVPIADAFDELNLDVLMTTFFADHTDCQARLPSRSIIENALYKITDTLTTAVKNPHEKLSPNQKDSIEHRRTILANTFNALLQQNDYVDNETVARATCFAATGDVSSSYMWGLLEKLDNKSVEPTLKSLDPEFLYICKDFDATASSSSLLCVKEEERQQHQQLHGEIRAVLPPRLSISIDLSYIPQPSLRAYHRSGWSYVLSGLMALENNTQKTSSPAIIMDSYVDRTFHWAQKILLAIGKIPYTRPWTGVIHHTFDETHSEYNCVKLLDSRAFLDSLPHCVCLFALSTDLATRLKAGLVARGHPDVPVHAVLHPTEFQPTEDSMFSIDKFIKSYPRKIVHIGAWLRNPYAIYELETAGEFHDGVPIQKCTLHGRDMTLYKPPSSAYMDAIKDTVRNQKDHKSVNKFVQGMLEMLERNEKSVQVIPMLDNNAYDVMLTNSVVFLNLVDASAVNTVLECVARNTPIIVNRLPAVEEVLGVDYPGFYTRMHDASLLCTNITQIARMHMHLTRLDKDALKLARFVSNVHAFLATSSSLGTTDR